MDNTTKSVIPPPPPPMPADYTPDPNAKKGYTVISFFKK